MALDLSDLGALNASQEIKLSKWMGISIEQVMAKRGKPCPPAAKTYARKLMISAISAAIKADILRRRGILSQDAEDNIRQIVGHVGIFLGMGTFESTFTTLTVLGEQDKILAKYIECSHSRRRTKTLFLGLRNDLSFLNKGGQELERIIPKTGDNYLMESDYLSIAVYIRGLSETAIGKLDAQKPK